MASPESTRRVHWMGSSHDDIRALPEEVKDDLGQALWVVQQGATPASAKPLKGLGGGVFEIVADYDTDTYRGIYTIRFREAIYVLHVFQKKSRHKDSTSRQDIELVERRLKAAARHYAEHYS